MKVKKLLNYIIEYEKEGFSLNDEIKVRMFKTSGDGTNYADFKDFDLCYLGGDHPVHILIQEDKADHWEWEE
jgi:hypothetical protein